MKPREPGVGPWFDLLMLAFICTLAGSCCCNLQGASAAEPAPMTLSVMNHTGEALVLDCYCEGYPYGRPQVVPHGEAASWEWRVGETTVSDGVRIWGPRMAATKHGRAIWVRLIP